MYNQISLKQLVDTLPLYDKKELSDKIDLNALESIQINFEDIYDSLSEFEKIEFIKNRFDDIEDIIADHPRTFDMIIMHDVAGEDFY